MTAVKASQWPGPPTSARVRTLCAQIAETRGLPLSLMFQTGRGARCATVVDAKVQIMVALSAAPFSWSPTQIAKFFGCHHTNVYHHLGALTRSTAQSQKRLERVLADALNADLGGANDPDAFGGPTMIRKTTGSRRRQNEIDRLAQCGVLTPVHVRAAQQYSEAILAPMESGRDSIDALSSSIGSGHPDGAHHYRMRLARAGMSLRAIQVAIRDRAGIQGLSIVDGIIERRLTAADIALRHGLTRTAPSGNTLGDARQAHGLIRAAFDALRDAIKSLDVRHEQLDKQHHAASALAAGSQPHDQTN